MSSCFLGSTVHPYGFENQPISDEFADRVSQNVRGHDHPVPQFPARNRGVTLLNGHAAHLAARSGTMDYQRPYCPRLFMPASVL